MAQAYPYQAQSLRTLPPQRRSARVHDCGHAIQDLELPDRELNALFYVESPPRAWALLFLLADCLLYDTFHVNVLSTIRFHDENFGSGAGTFFHHFVFVDHVHRIRDSSGIHVGV